MSTITSTMLFLKSASVGPFLNKLILAHRAEEIPGLAGTIFYQ